MGVGHAHLPPGSPSQPRLKPSHWGVTCLHLGTRFLKDSMWKRDKKDFACEMRKLKRLKGQLALMEHDYLTELQVSRRAARAPGSSHHPGV